MIIAIDGFAGSGKGTLAKKLARHLNYAYMDTGLLYRSVAFYALKAHISLEDENALIQIAKKYNLCDEKNTELRAEKTGLYASKISKFSNLRNELTKIQQDFVQIHTRGVILDGRDIGTVICPHADVKLFITASAEERAKRRIKELIERQITYDEEQMIEDIRKRDQQDIERSIAPLKAAEDAMIIDTTEMNAVSVFEYTLQIIENRQKELK